MKKFVLALIVLLGGAAAYKTLTPESPADFYQRYQAFIAKGRTFEEDASFYAAPRRAEVQDQIMAQGDEAESLKKAYLDFTSEQARCSDLELAEENRSGEVLQLVFNVTDTCGTYGEGATIREIIELVEEDGNWKILSNETSVDW